MSEIMSELTIKVADANDASVVLSFIKELAEYEKLAHEVVATEELLRENLLNKNSNMEVIIGYLQERPVAFAIYFHNFSSFLGRKGIYLEDLFVKPEARGNGLGQQMLVYIARVAKERGCGRLEWSVLDWNTPAIEFYKKLGAKAMDEWTVYRVTGDALDKLATN